MIDVSTIDRALPSSEAFCRMLGLKTHRGAQRGGVRILCPWHAEKHPSCDVAVRDGRIVATCRSCRGGGDALTLAASVWGLDAHGDFLEVAGRVADMLGVRLERGDHEPPPRDHVGELARVIDGMADAWLGGRGPSRSDEAAVNASSLSDIRAGLRRLRGEDEARLAAIAERKARYEAMTDEERDAALDAMAPKYADWGMR